MTDDPELRPTDAIHHERWICPECGEGHDSHAEFMGHLAFHFLEHSLDSEKAKGHCWECENCMKVFDSVEAYNNHTPMCGVEMI